LELLNLSDEQIYEIANPIWESMTQASNTIDYELFSNKFNDELKRRVTKDKFENQCKEVTLLTSLGNATPVACIRRDDGVTIIFKLLSTKLTGEFVGQLRLSGTSNNVIVTDAQVY